MVSCYKACYLVVTLQRASTTVTQPKDRFLVYTVVESARELRATWWGKK
ncbi:MAG: hypothetical protein LBV08_11310 [Clostridiales bacterium]|nr:hypothetical protein [Clostridiales bacterium]